mmetsp:Transcript_60093/g.82326  ORF Transcript_60093/g.82326 Transcript_60093/m.82326 type:complete len:85 (-) Transcript_60093:204-458(-)
MVSYHQCLQRKSRVLSEWSSQHSPLVAKAFVQANSRPRYCAGIGTLCERRDLGNPRREKELDLVEAKIFPQQSSALHLLTFGIA